MFKKYKLSKQKLPKLPKLPKLHKETCPICVIHRWFLLYLGNTAFISTVSMLGYCSAWL